jgi:hypothetical protein
MSQKGIMIAVAVVVVVVVVVDLLAVMQKF